MPWIVVALAFLALLAHVSKVTWLQVDGVTLAILGLLLAVPLVEYVRKIRIGEFEAEIAPHEIREARQRVTDEIALARDTDEDAEGVLALAESDPQLALAKLRIKLEEALRALASSTIGEDRARRMGIGRLADELVRRSVLNPGLAAAIRDVAPLANRAIHGEYVRPQDAQEIAELGVQVLSALRDEYRSSAAQPATTRPVSQEEVKQASTAKYRVAMIVPAIENPTEQEYVVDQAGLDYLLEGYDEYAAFITRIERLEDESPD